MPSFELAAPLGLKPAAQPRDERVALEELDVRVAPNEAVEAPRGNAEVDVETQDAIGAHRP